MNDSEVNKKIDKCLSDFMSIHKSFTSNNSGVYSSYLDVVNESMKDGKLKKVYKELTAVGISLAVNCEPCLVWHINEALKNGATEEQIVEVIQVAIQMGGGPIIARSNFAFNIIKYFKDKNK